MGRRPRSTPAEKCPDRQVLAAFHAGRLVDAELWDVWAHINACTACSAALGELGLETRDSLGDRLKDCWRADGSQTLSEPAYRMMAAAAAALAAGDTASHDDADGFTLDARSSETAADLRVGPYRVLGRIGRGGMGVVYKARHQTLNRLVALKTLRAGGCAGEEALERFRTEGEAVARLHHPNVVQIYEFGEHEGLPYYAMEWVDGGTLAAKLAAGPLGFREAAELVRTLGLAVDFAHHRQVLHRDLKPANVLLTAGGAPKVADFGLARLLDAEGDRLTVTDAVFGTPSYMSPEQAAGRTGELGPATDVYALGAILYETLTGRPPFLKPDRYQTLKSVIEEEVVRPSRHRPDVPADLEAVCLKCLERLPARRYASAAQLADDLDRWLRGGPTTARPLGRIGRAARVLVHRRRAIALGATAIGAIGAGTWALRGRGPGPDRASRDDRLAARELERRLIRDGSVTLIGDNGRPLWYRWRDGSSPGEVAIDQDGAFVVTHPGIGLLELLADPLTDRYLLAAQVRHDTSNDTPPRCEVGVYVGHVVYPVARGLINCFTHTSFNSVFAYPRPNLDVSEYPLQIIPRIVADDGARDKLDYTANDSHRVIGLGVRSLGERNGQWFDVEVVVSPETIDARINNPGSGETARASKTASEVDRMLSAWVTGSGGESWRAPPMPFVARAGIGLFVSGSTAAFRRVTVTQLRDRP